MERPPGSWVLVSAFATLRRARPWLLFSNSLNFFVFHLPFAMH